MPTKSVIAAVLGVALLIGAVVSGCNRNRGRDEFASAKTRRRAPSRQHELSSVRNVRPAEVLSASAYRPPARRNQARPEAPYRRQPGYDADPYSQPGYASAPRRRPDYDQASTRRLAVSPSAFGGDNVSYYTSPIQAAPAAPEIYSQPAASQRTYYEMYTPQPVYTEPAYQPQPVYSTQPAYPVQQAPAVRANDPYGHLPEYAYKPRQSYAPPAHVPSMPVSGAVSAPVRPRPQSPDLAMARAGLEPPPAPPSGGYGNRVPAVQPIRNGGYSYNQNYQNQARRSVEAVPPVEPGQFPAPLPELEPVRYQRVANNAPEQRVVPQVPVLMSARPQERQQPVRRQAVQQSRGRSASNEREREVADALAPLEGSGDWVPGTAVSMFR